jgi:hypothetical protein
MSRFRACLDSERKQLKSGIHEAVWNCSNWWYVEMYRAQLQNLWLICCIVCLVTGPYPLNVFLPRMQKPEAASAVLGSWWWVVSPETCRASYKYGIIKFWYTVASCWISLYELYYDARIHERQVQRCTLKRRQFEIWDKMPVQKLNICRLYINLSLIPKFQDIWSLQTTIQGRVSEICT